MKTSKWVYLELLILTSLLLSTLYVIGITDNRMSAEDTESIMAVSPIVGSEEYYLQTKKLNSRYPKQPEFRTRETKEDICESISRSSYFIDTFDDDYKSNVHGNHSVYARPAKCDNPDCLDLHDIFVLGNTVDEYIFTCRTENGNEFFVSREYNLFWWMEISAPHCSGRFVFKYEYKNDSSWKRFVVIAVAEKPASSKPSFFDSLDGEQNRYETMTKYRADHEVNDTILSALSAPMKVRLCTIVMSAFLWPFWFLPHPNNTELLTLHQESKTVNTSDDESLALKCESDNLRAKGERAALKIVQGDNRFTEFFAISEKEDIFAYLIR